MIYTKTRRAINWPGQAHLVNFHCFKSQGFLVDPELCALFLDNLNAVRQNHAFLVWSYVLMPNHVHLLLFPTEENYEMAQILRAIKQPVSQRVIAQDKKRDSPRLERFKTGLQKPQFRFWQPGGGFDRNLTSSRAIWEAIDYIHLNPVRAGLVESALDWRWSSAAALHGALEVPLVPDLCEVML